VRSDTAKIHKLVSKHLDFFETFVNKEAIIEMTRAAADSLVWKRLYEEACRDLSLAKNDIDALRFENAQKDGAAEAMKIKCIEKLNEGKRLWKMKVKEHLPKYIFLGTFDFQMAALPPGCHFLSAREIFSFENI